MMTGLSDGLDRGPRLPNGPALTTRFDLPATPFELATKDCGLRTVDFGLCPSRLAEAAFVAAELVAADLTAWAALAAEAPLYPSMALTSSAVGKRERMVR